MDSSKHKKLGRGIESLLGSDYMDQVVSGATKNDDSTFGSESTAQIAIDLIEVTSNQPRSQFDQHQLNQLASSIARDGIIQPLVVNITKTGYQLIAGERRLRAAKLAGLASVPVVIKNLNENDTLRVALVENIQRCNLNPIEEASAYKKIAEQWGYSHSQVATLLSKERVTVVNMIRLLDLPQKVCNEIIQGNISAGHGRAILMVPDDQLRIDACQLVIDNKMSVRATESMCRQWKLKLAEHSGSNHNLHQFTNHQLSKDSSTTVNDPNINNDPNNHENFFQSSTHPFNNSVNPQTNNSPKLTGKNLEKLTDDPNFKYLQQQLKERFATKVKFSGAKNHGKIEIFFYSDEDFNRIIHLIGLN